MFDKSLLRPGSVIKTAFFRWTSGLYLSNNVESSIRIHFCDKSFLYTCPTLARSAPRPCKFFTIIRMYDANLFGVLEALEPLCLSRVTEDNDHIEIIT